MRNKNGKEEKRSLYIGNRTGKAKKHILNEYKKIEQGYLTQNGKFDNKRQYSNWLQELDNFEKFTDDFAKLRVGESLVVKSSEMKMNDHDLNYIRTYFNFTIEEVPFNQTFKITRLEDPDDEEIKERRHKYYGIPRNKVEAEQQLIKQKLRTIQMWHENGLFDTKMEEYLLTGQKI